MNNNELLNRGVNDCHVKKDLAERLDKGDKLRVKFGIDPTGCDLHLGHAVVLRKLRAFQDAGHKVIFMVGTFTACIGDPTGKDSTRPPLNEDQVQENAKDYLKQASKVLDVDKLEYRENGEWLNPMTFKEIVQLASSFTVQQMLHRDMYEKRIKDGKEIALHEFLYPLMQGYDSVPLKADLELGGNDQLFNLMAGRQIQKKYNMKPQAIMTLPILIGLDGKEKMSKSLGNYIGINENPRDMFGKTMSIPDESMESWFELLTSISMEEVQEILKGHPRDAKIRLASEIVKEFHSAEEAEKAVAEFSRMFTGDKGLPDDIKEVLVEKRTYKALDLVVASGLCSTSSDARRMFKQNAVSIGGEKVTMDTEIFLEGELVVQVGKKRFAKLLVK